MLTLTRRPTQSLVIGNRITITVLDIKGSRVRLGVNAPPEVTVRRLEALYKTAADHRAADPVP